VRVTCGGSLAARRCRLKGGCRQDCLPHKALVLLFLILFVPVVRAGITLESPREYQVFQRGTKIAIRGRSTEGCTAASANGGALQVEAGCVFHGELQMAAGGWYKIAVRAGGAVAAVEHVGVGEVFVISGQSNSTNYGEELQRTRSGMVSTFNGAAWRLADDPQPGVQDSSKQGSFLPAFGDALYARLKVPIGVACVGSGGTSVRQWLPKGDRFGSPPTAAKFFVKVSESEWESDGRLFQGMVERIREVGPFRALLWHQGESDAHQGAGHELSGAEYRRMMERLISATRAATWDFPWMVAQVSYHTPSDPADAEIRAAQASLWKDKVAIQGPDTDTLTGDNRQNHGTGVHMSAKGLEAHGRMWAERVAEWISQLW
jgi:Carbohydrate esterase, sialic acid-specific acetylesterase